MCCIYLRNKLYICINCLGIKQWGAKHTICCATFKMWGQGPCEYWRLLMVVMQTRSVWLTTCSCVVTARRASHVTGSVTGEPTVRTSRTATTSSAVSRLLFRHQTLPTVITGSTAWSRLTVTRRRFWGFSPRRDDTLHRLGWHLAWRNRPKVDSSTPNITPIGAGVWGPKTKKYQNFGT